MFFFFAIFVFQIPQKIVYLYTKVKLLNKNFFVMKVDKILVKIRCKRQELNYSQEYMASVLQMKQANYNKIENGKVELTVPVLFKISKLLDLNVDELLNGYKAV